MVQPPPPSPTIPSLRSDCTDEAEGTVWLVLWWYVVFQGAFIEPCLSCLYAQQMSLFRREITVLNQIFICVESESDVL